MMAEPEEPLTQRDLLNLWPELDGLPHPCQAALLGLYVDGYTHEAIAEALGITTKTVEGHLHAIGQALQLPKRQSLKGTLLHSLVRRTMKERQ